MPDIEAEENLRDLCEELDIVFSMVQYLDQYLVNYDKKIDEIWEHEYQDMNSDTKHLLYVDINNTEAKKQFIKMMHNTSFYGKILKRKTEFLNIQKQINEEICSLEKELKIKN